MAKKLFKLTVFLWVVKDGFRVRRYETIRENLTWQEAKAARNKNRLLQIVPMFGSGGS